MQHPGRAPEVVHDLVNGSARSAAAAVDVINGFDVAIVQHEYGIYGGPDGGDLVPLLYALRVPSIVVLHTVLARPTPRQRAILDEVIGAASAVVTMTRTARTRLLDIYGADPEKVVVIPHGAADYRVAVTPREAGQPPMVLTWGLLGPGKGIEHAIDAIALLRDRGLQSPTRSPARRTRACGRATARPIGVRSSARANASRGGGSRPLRRRGSCPPAPWAT